MGMPPRYRPLPGDGSRVGQAGADDHGSRAAARGDGPGAIVTPATISALCLDAGDVRRAGDFWAAVLGAALEVRADGVGVIRSGRLPPLWINPVPEPKVVKNRVHLDLRAPSTAALRGLGAVDIADHGTFRVLADPEGNELCVFPGDEPDVGVAEPFALCVDSGRPELVAAWWAVLLGGTVGPGPDGAPRWLHGPAGLGAVTMKFIRVADERVVKNRMHWDVETDGLDALVAHGAQILRAPDDEIAWTVLGDVDGNVFCAFDR
jgi:hypothetical protein